MSEEKDTFLIEIGNEDDEEDSVTSVTFNEPQKETSASLSPWKKRKAEGRLPHRKRNKNIVIQMTEEEKQAFNKKLAASGLTQRELVQRALDNTEITSKDDIQTIKHLSSQVADLQAQLRRIGNNLNQAVRIMQIEKFDSDTVSVDSLEQIMTELEQTRKEAENLWPSLRQLTQNQSQK